MVGNRTRPYGLISIMMPAYNAEKFVREAIESVLAQSYPHWELVIVNDGSTDRTPEIISHYQDGRIKVYHQANRGEASARNTALEHATGEYLAFLDADDLYAPGHLEAAIAFLQAYPEHGGVYTDGYYINGNGERLRLLSSCRRGPFEGDIFEQMVRASDVFGPPVCVVLKTDIIARHGFQFDSDIVIGPDWDFLIRYAQVAEFGYVDRATCLYRLHQTNVSVRTAIQKRRLHLARCREKAIKLKRFSECSLETRAFVFYDLLVNLLSGLPERQSDITRWPEFQGLPIALQARLFRRMASEALSVGEEHPGIGEWLRLSRELNPIDPKGVALSMMYIAMPSLCRPLLKTSSQLRKMLFASLQNSPQAK